MELICSKSVRRISSCLPIRNSFPSLTPIVPYFLRTDSLIRYSYFTQTFTQIFLYHSQRHFRPKDSSSFFDLPVYSSSQYSFNPNLKAYFVRDDFYLRRTGHFNISFITFLSIGHGYSMRTRQKPIKILFSYLRLLGCYYFLYAISSQSYKKNPYYELHSKISNKHFLCIKITSPFFTLYL